MTISNKATILRPEDHEHFLTQGYIIVRQAVPPAILTKAVDALEADVPDPAFDPGIACTTDRIHHVISELFGPQYTFEKHRGGHDMARPYQPHEDWPPPVAHVDDSYPTLMPNGWAIGTFIFLTKVHSHGGAFIYFSGSPQRYRQAMAQSYHAIKEIAAAPHYAGPFQEFLAEPGDVLFFHHLMGHTGSNNTADPLTRHALLSRWRPHQRIVPGLKPFEHMSTIEKANSARYLEHRFDLPLQVQYTPTDTHSTTLLGDGFAGLGSILSYAILHYAGQAQLLFVTSAEPTQVRRLCSHDLIHWQDTDPLMLNIGPIRSLHLHQYGFAAILAITSQASITHVYQSDNFTQWHLLSSLQQSWTTTPWYIYANYPSKIAGGQALYVIPVADPSQAWCRWGTDWPTAAQESEKSLAVQAPKNCRINDLIIAARFSDSNCAIVADVQYNTSTTSQPYYTLPQDVAISDNILQPLAYSGDIPPHHIRIFNRGPSYWLLTFLRRWDHQDRLFWGYIDWDESPPTLRPLTDAAAFDQAKSTVGMI